MAWNILFHIIKASFSIFCLILKIGIQCWKLLFIKLFPLYPYYISSPIWLYSNEQGCARIAGLLAFTFQSGYIQMVIAWQAKKPDSTLHSNLVIFKSLNSNLFLSDKLLFTFQSGYIQIFKLFRLCHSCISLYIPIWLYSNWYAVGFTLELDFLYIPIWLYSNF